MHVLWLNGDSPVALLQTEALYIVKHMRSYYGQATLCILILLIIIGQMSSTDCISLPCMAITRYMYSVHQARIYVVARLAEREVHVNNTCITVTYT